MLVVERRAEEPQRAARNHRRRHAHERPHLAPPAPVLRRLVRRHARLHQEYDKARQRGRSNVECVLLLNCADEEERVGRREETLFRVGESFHEPNDEAEQSAQRFDAVETRFGEPCAEAIEARRIVGVGIGVDPARTPRSGASARVCSGPDLV